MSEPENCLKPHYQKLRELNRIRGARLLSVGAINSSSCSMPGGEGVLKKYLIGGSSNQRPNPYPFKYHF